jgi:hypothetical protein
VEAVFEATSVPPITPAASGAGADVPPLPLVSEDEASRSRHTAWAGAQSGDATQENVAARRALPGLWSEAPRQVDAESTNETAVDATRDRPPSGDGTDEAIPGAGHRRSPGDAEAAYGVPRTSRASDPQPVGVPAGSLPFDAGAIERRLRGLLDEVEALGRRLAGKSTSATVTAQLAAFIALVAGVELLLLGSRRPKGTPVLLFNKPGDPWGPSPRPAPPGSCRRLRRGGD